MTIQELNRDIKRLSKYIKQLSNEANATGDVAAFFSALEQKAKPEFIRLYHASDNFSKISKPSILILVRLNLSHRFVAFHQFGNKIEI